SPAADVKNINDERSNISKAASGKKLHLAAVEQRLKDLRDQQGRLSRFIKDIGDSLNAEPIRRKALGQLAEARLLEEQADYESAIALYKQIEGKKELDEAQRSAIGKHRRELEKAWQTKGKEHEAAREFIYKKWAQLDLTREIKTNLPEAEKSFKACRTAGDRL